jgi:shikimate kinase
MKPVDKAYFPIIVLIGFMGSGKSSLGRRVARELRYEFLDLDKLILDISGFASIPDIFNTKGEEHFRSLEREAAKIASSRKKVVIATGGGIVSYPLSMGQLLNRKSAKIIFLNASFEAILSRVGGDNNRPLLKDPIEAKKLWEKRQPQYRKWADHTIFTDGLGLDKITEKIVFYTSR